MYKIWATVKLLCLLSFLNCAAAIIGQASCASLFAPQIPTKTTKKKLGYIPVEVIEGSEVPKGYANAVPLTANASKSAWASRLHGKNETYDALVADKNTEIHMIEGFSQSYGVRDAFRSTVEKEGYFLETVDTLVRDYEWWGEAKAGERAAFYSEMRTAKIKQKQWLDEIADVVLLEYINRRGWSPAFVEGIRKKIYSTANATRYVVARSKNPDGSKGKIIGVIGLQRASYGTVTFFNKKSGRWEKRTGPFGPAYDSNYDSNFNLSPESIAKWAEPVPLLAAEVYLNQNFYRPSVIYKIDPPGTTRPSHEASNESFEVDTTKPVYYGAGEIFEPVRFYLAKNEGLKREVHRQMATDIFMSIFPSTVAKKYSIFGQFLYTYNSTEGVRLYKAQGFQALAGMPKQWIDSSEWTPLGASPVDFTLAVNSLLIAKEDQRLDELIHFLRENTLGKENY